MTNAAVRSNASTYISNHHLTVLVYLVDWINAKVKAWTRAIASVVVKDLRLKDGDKDKDKESSFKDKDKDKDGDLKIGA